MKSLDKSLSENELSKEEINLLFDMLAKCNHDVQSMNYGLKASFAYLDLMNRAKNIYNNQNFSKEDKIEVKLKMQEINEMLILKEDNEFEAEKLYGSIVENLKYFESNFNKK